MRRGAALLSAALCLAVIAGCLFVCAPCDAASDAAGPVQPDTSQSAVSEPLADGNEDHLERNVLIVFAAIGVVGIIAFIVVKKTERGQR